MAAALRHLAPLGARLTRLPPRDRAAGRLLLQRRGIRLSAPAPIQVGDECPERGVGERGSSPAGEASGPGVRDGRGAGGQ